MRQLLAVARTVGAPMIVTLVAVACTQRSGADVLPKRDPRPMDLVVLHTNDVWGETRPCG